MEQIYYNGTIVTMKGRSAQEEIESAPEAVWVKDGLIAGTGKRDDLLKMAGHNVCMVNLEGHCLMPSFIDAHSHILMNGQMSMFADLSQCSSFDEIIRTLEAYMESHCLKEENVLVGYGYDHNFLKEKSHPDKRVLDQVSDKIPIFILHVSAHLACANSAALRLAGMNESTPDPEGGMVGRIGEGREPSGYVEETAMSLIQKAVMSRVQVDIAQMVLTMQEAYIANGVTTVQEGAASARDMQMLMNISESGSLKVDIVSYLLMTAEGSKFMKRYGEQYGSYRKHLRIGGYKLILDGSPQGRTAWMTKPYEGEDKDYCGYPWMEDAEVQNCVESAAKEHRQIMAHCNGDAASEQFIQACEKCFGTNDIGKKIRPVMIHCQTVSDEQLDRMGHLNMIASFFAGHVWYWGDIHLKNFGKKRGNHISPAKSALDKGVVVTFHQDTPVAKPDMLHTVWCAVNRISRGGAVIGRDQAIDVYEALRAVTINAAFQYFEEHSKGSIAKGKRADLVILDRSPLETDKLLIKDISVLETIKDGETIYRKQ